MLWEDLCTQTFVSLQVTPSIPCPWYFPVKERERDRESDDVCSIAIRICFSFSVLCFHLSVKKGIIISLYFSLSLYKQFLLPLGSANYEEVISTESFVCFCLLKLNRINNTRLTRYIHIVFAVTSRCNCYKIAESWNSLAFVIFSVLTFNVP